MSHLAKLTPVNGVITDTASFPKKFRKYVLQFNTVVPNVAGEPLQLTMPYGGLFNSATPWTTAWSDGDGNGGRGVTQASAFVGVGEVNGSLNIWNPSEPNTPAVVIEGNISAADGTVSRVKNFWLGSGASAGFTLAYPSGIKSGSVDVYGIN